MTPGTVDYRANRPIFFHAGIIPAAAAAIETAFKFMVKSCRKLRKVCAGVGQAAASPHIPRQLGLAAVTSISVNASGDYEMTHLSLVTLLFPGHWG